jgi:hypothetical protein
MLRKRLLVLLPVVVLSLALAAPPASARTNHHHHRKHHSKLADLAGDMSGVATWTGPTPDCGTVPMDFNATYPGKHRAGDVTLHIHACVASEVPIVGTFDIATKRGTLTGTVSGTPIEIASPIVFDFDLAPTSGTGRYEHTKGTLHFRAEWDIGSPAGSPFTATMTVNKHVKK